ncbi:MAG: hypothetical protein NUV74_15035 [Candidatus Brocadiaceae bacterium]|nr:hypothetical protein [Candidatus Brocadiaceae bacterium]
MHGIVSALSESNLFKSIDILDLIDENSAKLIKIKAKGLDGTILYIDNSRLMLFFARGACPRMRLSGAALRETDLSSYKWEKCNDYKRK